MTRTGLVVALQYSDDLPAFAALADAEAALFTERNTAIRHMLSEVEELDYSPDSLKAIESWFFSKGSPKFTADGYPVSLAIGYYFGEVSCRNAGFTWIVKESPFISGRFEIGVQRGRCTLMLTKGRLPRGERNKSMQSLWRNYKKYCGPMNK